MASYNKVLLMGNLTRDPELRMTPKGTAICQFGLAVNRRFRDESGADREEVTFLDIEAWGKQAETIAKYMSKGRPIFLEGRLRLDQWEDKNTKEKRSRLKIVCENFQFVGGQAGQAGAAAPAADSAEPTTSVERNSPPPRQPGNRPAAPTNRDVDEDVPF